MACTVSGNPLASVSRPRVICGSSLRSFENPGSRNPSPVSVSKYSVETSKSTKLAGPNPACACCTCASQRLPPAGLGIATQATLDRGIRRWAESHFA